MRTLPQGVDQRSACRHPDWTGPDDLAIKIQELRELTDWEKPIYVKVGATARLQRRQAGGARRRRRGGGRRHAGRHRGDADCFIEHVGIPTLAAVRQAVDALEDLNMNGKVQLIVSGGIRSGADVAKALALGADAVAIGQGILVALGCNSEDLRAERRAPLGARGLRRARHRAGFCHHCHTGKCPVGVTTRTACSSSACSPTSDRGACATTSRR
jgi:glutamate synthase domain-containing protein 2